MMMMTAPGRLIEMLIPRPLQVPFLSGIWIECPLGLTVGQACSVGSNTLALMFSSETLVSCCVYTSLVQDDPPSPAISSLSHPIWISLHSSQLCFCTRSKYLPSGTQILLSFLPAHSWDDYTRELISTTFLIAAPSLEYVQLYLIFLLPLKHGILSGLAVFISLMDTRNKSLACFTSITPLFPSGGREFQGVLPLSLCVERKKKSFRLERANWDNSEWLFCVFRILWSPTYYFCGPRSLMHACGTEFKFLPETPYLLHWRGKYSPSSPLPPSPL